MASLIPVTTNRVDPKCAICLDGFNPGERQWNHVGGEGHDPLHRECLESSFQSGYYYCPHDRNPINPNFPAVGIFEKTKQALINTACAATLGIVGAGAAAFVGGAEVVAAAAIGAGVVGAGEILRGVIRSETGRELSIRHAVLVPMAAGCALLSKIPAHAPVRLLGFSAGMEASAIGTDMERLEEVRERYGVRLIPENVIKCAVNSFGISFAGSLLKNAIGRIIENKFLSKSIIELRKQAENVGALIKQSSASAAVQQGSQTLVEEAKRAQYHVLMREEPIYDEYFMGISQGLFMGVIAGATKDLANTMFGYLRSSRKNQMSIHLGMGVGALATLAVAATSPVAIPIACGLSAGLITLLRG